MMEQHYETFPRFSLLSQDEQKVTATAPIKEAIHAAAPKVFEAARVFDFDASGDITGFFGQGADPSDQVIKFIEPVKCGDDRGAIFANLKSAMQAVVKRDLHAQIAQNTQSVDAKPVGIAEALLIADEVFYTKMVEQALPEGGLYVALEKASEMLKNLIDHVKVEKSAGMQRLLNARIIVAITWKRRISKLVKASCKGVSDMLWKSYARFYLEDD